MIVLLQHYEGSWSSEHLAVQAKLEQCARRLESFVSPIRMSQVIKTGNGPLDGMRRKITELSEHPQKRPQKQTDISIRTTSYHEEANIITPALSSSVNMGSKNGGTRQPSGQSATTVAEALEIARESEEGPQDPVIRNLLETALTSIWSKIEAQPTSYIMTREEFAVFNYFQRRFEEMPLASAAMKRYWDHPQYL
jgi:hypothetical protein